MSHRTPIKDYDALDFVREYELLERGVRILNAGSGSVRYGSNCVNLDVQAKPDVDILADLHALPDALGTFGAVVCNAALQYCHDPRRVADELWNVLDDGGLIFVDAPWVQAYSPDTPDKWRFSEPTLRELFGRFEILKSGASIRPGSALVMLAQDVASTLTGRRLIDAALVRIVGAALSPIRYIRTRGTDRTAGAYYLVGRKRAERDRARPGA